MNQIFIQSQTQTRFLFERFFVLQVKESFVLLVCGRWCDKQVWTGKHSPGPGTCLRLSPLQQLSDQSSTGQRDAGAAAAAGSPPQLGCAATNRSVSVRSLSALKPPQHTGDIPVCVPVCVPLCVPVCSATRSSRSAPVPAPVPAPVCVPVRSLCPGLLCLSVLSGSRSGLCVQSVRPRRTNAAVSGFHPASFRWGAELKQTEQSREVPSCSEV